jgi:hypothetical protein
MLIFYLPLPSSKLLPAVKRLHMLVGHLTVPAGSTLVQCKAVYAGKISVTHNTRRMHFEDPTASLNSFSTRHSFHLPVEQLVCRMLPSISSPMMVMTRCGLHGDWTVWFHIGVSRPNVGLHPRPIRKTHQMTALPDQSFYAYVCARYAWSTVAPLFKCCQLPRLDSIVLFHITSSLKQIASCVSPLILSAIHCI